MAKVNPTECQARTFLGLDLFAKFDLGQLLLVRVGLVLALQIHARLAACLLQLLDHCVDQLSVVDVAVSHSHDLALLLGDGAQASTRVERPECVVERACQVGGRIEPAQSRTCV